MNLQEPPKVRRAHLHRQKCIKVAPLSPYQHETNWPRNSLFDRLARPQTIMEDTQIITYCSLYRTLVLGYMFTPNANKAKHHRRTEHVTA
jgi:hypothetical protein